MNWLNSHKFSVGGSSVTYSALLISVAVLVFGLLLASKVSNRIRTFGGVEDVQIRRRVVATRVVGYGIRIATIVIALHVTGIDVTTVLAASAVLAVGIGIAMQKVAENFVSGVILFAEQAIREGDIIEFEGCVARVQRVGIRATIALTLDDVEIIVPNSILAQNAVKNLTLTEMIHRLHVRVGVAYETDVDKAAEVLLAAAESISWRDPDHKPVVLLLDFGASSIDFEVSVWTRDVWLLRRWQSELRKTLWRAIRDNGISIPFPQIDVHFPTGMPEIKPS
jgi:small-conductance mechanosensitive channel